MSARFRHAAIVGKFQAQGIRGALEDVAHFLEDQGLEVSFESATATATGVSRYAALSPAQMGAQCDLAVVVGGDGTMLGIGRELARYNLPLVGINQGRLGFITDIRMDQFREVLAPMIRGEFVEDHRSMIEGGVWRDGECIFEGLSMNDVVVSRGATASMVELKVDIGDDFVANLRADGLIVASPTGSTAYASHTLSNRPIVLPDHGEIRIEIVAGRDASANFDMQSLASLLHGDQVRVRRSKHRVRFLHPLGWSYYATLRRKLRWYEGGV